MDGNNQESNIGGRISGSEIEASINSPSINPQHGKTSLKNPSKKIIIGLVVGLAVVLVGGAVALAFGFWNPSWNPFQPSPDRVIEQSVDNMSQIKTIHFEAIVNAAGKDNGEEVSVKMKIEGDSDNLDKDNPKSQTSIDFSVPIEGMEMLFSAEMRSIDEIGYFKIGNLPVPFTAQLSAMGIDIGNWTNKWFRIDPKELGMSFKKLTAAEKEKIKEEMKELFWQYPPVKVAKKLPGEKIGDQMTYHYLLALDKENITEFLFKWSEIVRKYYPQLSPKALSEEEKAKMREDVDKFFEQVGRVDFEIWIGKKDKYIYKIGLEKAIDLPSPGKKVGEMKPGNIFFKIDFSRFDEPVDIKKPEESQSAMELLAPLMQEFMRRRSAPKVFPLKTVPNSSFPGGGLPGTAPPPTLPSGFSHLNK